MEPLTVSYASSGHSRIRSRTGVHGAVWWAMRIAWTILGTVLVAGISMSLSLHSPLLEFVSPLWTLTVLVGLVVMMRSLRREWDLSTLNYLDQAMRLNLPLPAMLRAAESGERALVRRRLRRLRDQIEEGSTVADALEWALPGLSPRMRGLVAAAERTGQLAPTLRRVLEQSCRKDSTAPILRFFFRWYPIVFMLALTAVISGIGLFAMPKFMGVWSDFHVQMPGLAFWRWVENRTPLILPVIALIVLIFLGQMFLQLFHPRYTRLMQWLSDPVAWRLPIVRSRALADLCHFLASVLAAGQPLPTALFDAAETGTNHVLRRRIGRWAKGVSAGKDVERAAREAGMPALISGMVATGAAAGDLPRVFHFLANYYDNRLSRSAVLLEATAMPAMALFFGIVVAMVALSLFVPLTELIDQMMQRGTGW